jgi:hypothetical protein
MPILSTAFWIVCGIGIVFSILTFFNLAPGQNAAWRALTRGPFADKSIYTSRGWMYRNITLSCVLIAVLLLLLQSVF